METGNPCPVSQAEPVTEGTNREQCLSRLKLASLDINSQIWVAGAEKKICVTHINPFIPEVVQCKDHSVSRSARHFIATSVMFGVKELNT